VGTSTDISETEKEYVIRAELPAVRKEDVQAQAAEGETDQRAVTAGAMDGGAAPPSIAAPPQSC
jgi:2-phospho-L-lactate guanylyltransferase (CobY/MobA/RfbA family)